MKITIIHGSPNKGGNTHKVAELFKEAMQAKGEIEFKEFFLPEDLPETCTGCAACIDRGREECPHAQYTLPILDALLNSDAFIFTSAVYVMQLSGALKSFLDHFSHIFIAHRPEEAMFSKKAFILTTANVFGLSSAKKTIKASLKWWGVNRIYSLGIPIMGLSFTDIKPKRRERLERKIASKAARFYKEIKSGKKRVPYFSTWFMFKIMGLIIKRYKEGVLTLDKAHWQERNWFKKTPF